ncbi:hypothetical protein KKC65_00880 [Patescibacteria group bacterium]|nr:hypothetical protein [Patescibacteria group bacterium]
MKLLGKEQVMKRIVTLTIVLATLIFGSTTSAQTRSRGGGSHSYSRSRGETKEYLGGFVTVGSSHGRSSYGRSYGNSRYGRHHQVYDKTTIRRQTPNSSYSLDAGRKGGVITGVMDFLFGRNELSINSREGSQQAVNQPQRAITKTDAEVEAERQEMFRRATKLKESQRIKEAEAENERLRQEIQVLKVRLANAELEKKQKQIKKELEESQK